MNVRDELHIGLTSLSNDFRKYQDNVDDFVGKSRKDIEQLNEKVRSQLSSFQIPQMALDSLNALKTELLSKMEGITLDANNALLKASNSSQQIMILEKKMENLALNVKKNELAR